MSARFREARFGGGRPRGAPPWARPRIAGALVLVASACGDATSDAPSPTDATATAKVARVWFEEVAASAGVTFVHDSGHATEFFTPEVVCGGVALFDMDGDDDLDLYFVQSGSLVEVEARAGNRLYRNEGAGAFRDATDGSGTDDRGYGIGAATGDVDNDGDLDLYVTNLGANVLFRNDGGGTFADVGRASGTDDDGFGSSAAFFDYDVDGKLDLFVANYLIWTTATEQKCFNSLGQRDYCAPVVYNAPAVDVLLHNEGGGAFVDVSERSGITSAFGTGLGVVCGDFSADGLVDVFVANDGRMDQLWINLGDGRFEDRALILGCAMDQDGKAKAGMGVTAADIDDDGDLDVLVSNLRRESDSVYRNDGTRFADISAVSGLALASRAFTRFGTGWADFDGDGRLDLYQANGRVSADADDHGTADALAEPNLLRRGLGGARFEEVLPRGGTDPVLVHTSRGAAFGDIDGDGDVDVVVANRDAAPYVLRNVVGQQANWLLVRVLDEHGRDALGATVTLTLGERAIRRDVRTAYGYCSASDPRVHFGLGEHTRVDALEVRWVDGARQAVALPGVNRVLTVRRDDTARR